MRIYWRFLFSFYCGCCFCGCQYPSCPIHLQMCPVGVDNEAHFMIHTGPLPVHIRLTMWWKWSTCSRKGTLLVLSQVCHTGIASCFSIVSLMLLFPSYFSQYFLWVFLLLGYACNHGILTVHIPKLMHPFSFSRHRSIFFFLLSLFVSVFLSFCLFFPLAVTVLDQVTVS